MPFNRTWAGVAVEAPDARAKRVTDEKRHALLGIMEPVFCVNCGRPHGMVIKEATDYIFVLCDDCVEKHGRPPAGLEEVPEEVVKHITGGRR